MPAVVQLPAGKALTARAAADAFLDSLRNPNTVRSYGVGVGKTAERIGEGRPLGSVADDEIGEASTPSPQPSTETAMPSSLASETQFYDLSS